MRTPPDPSEEAIASTGPPGPPEPTSSPPEASPSNSTTPPAGNTTGDWVSFQVGTINADNGNLTDDDYGILFRQNGGTERFDNTVNLGAGGAFSATAGPRRVEISYAFSSFADGASVTATSKVDGTQVASDTFTWDSNVGAMYMELGHNDPNLLVDNLTVSVIPEPSSALLSSLAILGLIARRRR